MTPCIAALLLSSTLLGADADAERVVDRIREHFREIKSIHVRAVQRIVKEGRLLAVDPLAAPAVYDAKFLREDDVWVDPPMRRVFIKETKGPGAETARQPTSSVETYFDGTTYTYLEMLGRTGLVIKSGSLVKPLDNGPLQAIGYCFMKTYHTSLAALLSDVSKVKVEKLATVNGSVEWLVWIKGLPADVQTHGWSEQQRSRTQVRIWLTIEPTVLIKRLAVYLPVTPAQKQSVPLRGTIPSFEIDGYALVYAFVNIYEDSPVREEPGGPHIRMPRRILHGNGNCTYESIIKEVTINPRSTGKTFLPDLQAGFSISRPNADGDMQVSISGGRKGSVVRVREITEGAKELLGSADSLQAPPDTLSAWVVPIGCGALVLAGSALVFFSWRRKP